MSPLGPSHAVLQHEADELQRGVQALLVVVPLLREDEDVRIRPGLGGAENIGEGHRTEVQPLSLEGGDLPAAIQMEASAGIAEERDRGGAVLVRRSDFALKRQISHEGEGLLRLGIVQGQFLTVR